MKRELSLKCQIVGHSQLGIGTGDSLSEKSEKNNLAKKK
jgi:hypothetical protein